MKYIVYFLVIIIIGLGSYYYFYWDKKDLNTFGGVITETSAARLADGECYIKIGEKKITTAIGWVGGTVGRVTVNGVEVPLGDTEKYIGKNANVFAKMEGQNSYTLYGDENYFIKITE